VEGIQRTTNIGEQWIPEPREIALGVLTQKIQTGEKLRRARIKV